MSKLSKSGGKKILLFPGQGSQYAGMGSEFTQKFYSCKDIYQCGSDILGLDLGNLLSNGNEAMLSNTMFSQPAIFTASLISLQAMRESGLLEENEFHASMGHSLGEIAALVCCGVLDMENGFKLIKARSRIMGASGSKTTGGMSAVIGAELQDIERICEQVSGGGDYVTVANYNCPGQFVISGTMNGLLKAEELLAQPPKSKGFKLLQKKVRPPRIIRLKVTAAFHSDLMKEAAEEFLQEASAITFAEPKADFYSNVTAKKMTDFSEMPAYLSKHICSPVKFGAQLQVVKEDGYDTFIEVGPGKVLSGLVGKTLNEVFSLNIEDMESLEKAKEALK
ncbi:MAG: ACP S-malonyltransferase [Oscillospiraceae bacterium]|nr:ACP S-malonyltransferase [Oscillospiraceae bacterium]